MSDTVKPDFNPSKEKPYFVHDPLGDTFSYFASDKDRDDHADDVIQGYLDDGWDEEVENVLVGKVTGVSAMTDVQYPVGKIDEHGDDEAGEWWDQFTFRCNYKIMPLDYVPPVVK